MSVTSPKACVNSGVQAGVVVGQVHHLEGGLALARAYGHLVGGLPAGHDGLLDELQPGGDGVTGVQATTLGL